MKILQINSVCGYGSTGRNAVEIANELHKCGDQCYIAYGFGDDHGFPNAIKTGDRLDHYYHNIYSRVTGRQGYCSRNATIKLIQKIKAIDPDIIHLNNLHAHYLNLELFFKHLAETNKPVVWTLHDCWAFTGKCAHYTAIGCYKWQTHCNHCPQVRQYPPSLFLDYSEQAFTDKKRLFTSIKKLTIVPVSHWLASEVKKSFLSIYNIKTIYNWVDRNVFKPVSADALREKYHLKNKFVILGVSSLWIPGKGLKDFLSISQKIDHNSVIILVGSRNNINLPSNIISIPRTADVNELAQWYSLADVFINPSLEETFGKVTVEAMSCGTPAIVYNSTASPELIGAGCGYVIEPGNIENLLLAIANIKKTGKSNYTASCCTHVEKNFNKTQCIHEYKKVYQDLLSGNTYN